MLSRSSVNNNNNKKNKTKNDNDNNNNNYHFINVSNVLAEPDTLLIVETRSNQPQSNQINRSTRRKTSQKRAEN